MMVATIKGRSTGRPRGQRRWISATGTTSDDLGTKAEDAGGGNHRRTAFSLVRWFAIVSLAAIIIIGGAVNWFLTRYLTTHMLIRDAEVSRDFLESIVSAEKTRDLLLPFAPRPSAEALAPFVDHLPTLPDLVRANLYAADRTVLWSTDKQLIGQSSTKIKSWNGRFAVRSL